MKINANRHKQNNTIPIRKDIPLSILQGSSLYLITNRHLFANEEKFLNAIKIAIGAGIDFVQLREKDMSSAELFNLADKIKQIIKNTKTKLIINDRIDIMQAVDADGVHLGWQSLPIEKVKKLVNKDKIIGLSCHTLEEIKNINDKNIKPDYVILSPIFFTPSKQNILNPLGLSTLKIAVNSTLIPIIALGGINENNLKDIFINGAVGAAFIRAILEVEDIALQVKKLIKIKNECSF